MEQEPVDIFALAEKPIGSPSLQEEAEQLSVLAQQGQKAKASPELAETIHRTGKKWLPAGKRSAVDANRRAHEDCMARQTDPEDAVEKAGGSRGSARSERPDDPMAELPQVRLFAERLRRKREAAA